MQTYRPAYFTDVAMRLQQADISVGIGGCARVCYSIQLRLQHLHPWAGAGAGGDAASRAVMRASSSHSAEFSTET